MTEPPIEASLLTPLRGSDPMTSRDYGITAARLSHFKEGLVAPEDGTTLVMFQPTIVSESLLGEDHPAAEIVRPRQRGATVRRILFPRISGEQEFRRHGVWLLERRAWYVAIATVMVR
jgi:hypothetical protein